MKARPLLRIRYGISDLCPLLPMAGHVSRIVRNSETRPNGEPNPEYRPEEPLLWCEYLMQDDERGIRWTRNEHLAMRFPSHGLADQYAAKLRTDHPELGQMIHGGVSGPADPAARESRMRARPRQTPRERIEEEMRADDLAKMEQGYLDD